MRGTKAFQPTVRHLHDEAAVARQAARPHSRFTYMMKRSWLDKQLVLTVEGAPLVGILSTASLPRLQVDGRPHHVHGAERNETIVVGYLNKTSFIVLCALTTQHSELFPYSHSTYIGNVYVGAYMQ